MRIVRKTLRLLPLILGGLVFIVGCQDLRHAAGPPLKDPPDGTIRIATYNVHYILAREQKGRWGLEGWDARKEPLSETVRSLEADIIAFQEMETFSGGNDDNLNLTRMYLLDNMPGFAAAAVGDWETFPSTQPIFYLQSRYSVMDEGWFFFSETPDIIYSRTFNGSYPAFASWVQFREIERGALFRVVNLHTDYASRENRAKSIELVVERVRPWIEGGETVFLAGDFNARLNSALHHRLGEAGFQFVPVQGATYHFDIGLNLFGAIDHIGYFGATPRGAPMVFRQKLGKVWPTDHYPVVADFFLE